MHLMKVIQQTVIVASLLLLSLQLFRGSNRTYSYAPGGRRTWGSGSSERWDEEGSYYRLASGDGGVEVRMMAGGDADWETTQMDGKKNTLIAKINSMLLTVDSPPEPPDVSEVADADDELSLEEDKDGEGSLEMLENMEMMLGGSSSDGPPSMVSAITMSRQSLPPEGEVILTPWKERKDQTIRTLGRVTRELLGVLPEKDVLAGKHFNTCAVVGNAGLLLEDEFGPSIDSHDMVMRFNVAPTKGFEKHVGHKTTIRLVNRKHFGFRETQSEIVLQHLTIKELIPEFVKLRQSNLKAPTYALDMSFYDQVLVPEHQFPTNGYFGIHLALMLCRKIDVYGFLREWKGWVPYHYFNAEEPNDHQTPRDTREWSMIELLVGIHADRLRMMHPCIFDDKCDGCSRGALCNGHQPFPIPRLGYCRLQNTSCFFMCKPGIYLCGKGAKGECVDQLHKLQCVPPHGLDTSVLGASM